MNEIEHPRPRATLSDELGVSLWLHRSTGDLATREKPCESSVADCWSGGPSGNCARRVWSLCASKVVRLRNNKLKSLHPLGLLSFLSILDAANNQIESVEDLMPNSRLEIVDLSNNCISYFGKGNLVFSTSKGKSPTVVILA